MDKNRCFAEIVHALHILSSILYRSFTIAELVRIYILKPDWCLFVDYVCQKGYRIMVNTYVAITFSQVSVSSDSTGMFKSNIKFCTTK